MCAVPYMISYLPRHRSMYIAAECPTQAFIGCAQSAMIRSELLWRMWTRRELCSIVAVLQGMLSTPFRQGTRSKSLRMTSTPGVFLLYISLYFSAGLLFRFAVSVVRVKGRVTTAIYWICPCLKCKGHFVRRSPKQPIAITNNNVTGNLPTVSAETQLS